jgi:hydroxypyruvate isomerase
MPKFSANLSMLFCEHPFIERFSAAANAGFNAVEYVSPYSYPPKQITDLLCENNLQQVLFNMPAGDWEKGERGIACHPDRAHEFRDGVGKVIDYAKALGCPKVNCLAGILPKSMSRGDAFETLVANVTFAAAELKKENILLLVEPINFHDIPGFFLNTSKDGMSVLDAVGSDNLKLQYDVYHMQRMEGRLEETLTQLMPRIGHIQIADDPGRHEPGTGNINYKRILGHIDALGYDGWIGAEYKPLNETRAGLNWMTDHDDT